MDTDNRIPATEGLSASLVEDSSTRVFSLDSGEKMNYFCKQKCGILNREYNGEWRSSARALKNADQSRVHLLEGLRPPKNPSGPPPPAMDPGKLLRDADPLLKFLDGFGFRSWKISFRCLSQRRLVLVRGRPGINNRFDHFSLVIRAALPHMRSPVEVGEGSTRSFRFNLTGLQARIEDMAENHRGARPVDYGRKLPVVLGAGDGAIVLHEILGHSLEADHIHRGMSVFSIDDLGRRVVSPGVTLKVRDGNDSFFAGLASDDEGEEAMPVTLVEEGVLRGFISDFFYRRLLGMPFSGHSRVQDYTRIPMPRMYALYLAAGQSDREELIRSIRFGIFAKEFGEGKVLFRKNLFYFYIRQATLIERGRLTQPLGGIYVSGRIDEVLNSIAMVASDFSHDKGISYCNKNGQTLNVRVGQPTVRIDNMWVSRGGND